MVAELLLSAAWACDPVAPAALDAELAEAEVSFAALDIEGFLARSDAVRAAVGCLSAVPTPVQVARLHRVEGLRRFGDRELSAVGWLAAARSADPAFTWPPEVAPPGSPLAADSVAVDLASGTTTPLPEPLEGALWVDGAATRDRPAAWPSLVQWVGPDGAVRFTVWGPPDTAVPEYPAVIPPPPPPAPEPPPPPPLVTRRSARVPLLVATASTAVVTGAVYGAGAWSRATWADPTTPDAELPGLKARTNALAVGSVLGAAATLGLGVGLAVSW